MSLGLNMADKNKQKSQLKTSDNRQKSNKKGAESQGEDTRSNVFRPNFADILEKAGLTGKEAVIYEALLKSGEVGIREVAGSAPYKRGDVYNILYSLRDKGLVQQNIRGNKISFRPNDPKLLENYLQSEQDRLREAKSVIGSITPALEEMYKMTTERPVVRVYEGVTGIKEIYEDTLKVKKTTNAFLNLSEADDEVYGWLRRSYSKRRKDAGIRARVIVSAKKDDPKTKEYIEADEEELRQTRTVNFDMFPAYLEVQVYGDKVSFANYKKGEALVGVIIENEYIAKTMESMFFLSWNSAKQG